MTIRVNRPRVFSSIEVALPCDLCGQKVATVSFYLQAQSDKQEVKGFYPSLLIRLCHACLERLEIELRKEMPFHAH